LREKQFERSSFYSDHKTNRRELVNKNKEQKLEARKRKEVDSLNKKEEVVMSHVPSCLLPDNHSTRIRRRIRRTITVKESQQPRQEGVMITSSNSLIHRSTKLFLSLFLSG
jgi:hypothetical protein